MTTDQKVSGLNPDAVTSLKGNLKRLPFVFSVTNDLYSLLTDPLIFNLLFCFL